MASKISLLAKASRPEFLPANMGSLIIGIAWSLSSSQLTWLSGLLALLALLTLTIISAIGAQLNTLSDHALDSTDTNKNRLVQAVSQLGIPNIKKAVMIELAATAAVLIPFLLLATNPIPLLLIWMAGIFLAWAYSMPPLRLKSRSWLAFLSLSLVLSALPVSFIYLTFASSLAPLFLLFLLGHTLTVYAIIIPTEIRDYFSDRAGGVKTMTVYLGLKRASLFSIALLIAGPLMAGASLLIAFSGSLLSFSILLMAAMDILVLRQIMRLHGLAAELERTQHKEFENKLVELAKNNPKWITMVSMGTMVVNVILLLTRVLGVG